jgi:hypothetical protein
MISPPKPNLRIEIPPIGGDVLEAFEQPAGPSRPQPKRCALGGCGMRLGLTAFACRCGGYYCSAHRADMAHSCTYDYHAEQKQLLSTQLVKMSVKKVDEI